MSPGRAMLPLRLPGAGPGLLLSWPLGDGGASPPQTPPPKAAKASGAASASSRAHSGLCTALRAADSRAQRTKSSPSLSCLPGTPGPTPSNLPPGSDGAGGQDSSALGGLTPSQHRSPGRPGDQQSRRPRHGTLCVRATWMPLGLAWAAAVLACCPPQLPGRLVLRRDLRADGGLPRGGPGWVPAHTTGPATPGAVLRSSRAGGQGRLGEQGPQRGLHCPPLA
ncbi:cuticle collagen 40-like [Enhydra lutris kenyoni]|uniref:Cuticle collagen 40-like n=1 Tax=Enhydra lutris kenyoni TaxID=391180 RepID=A0A2Y9JA87_ENHLU|nr:cuticle collagen 40-like [Enhydra lutris kenyoni]